MKRAFVCSVAVALSSGAAFADNPPVVVAIDSLQSRHAIDPRVYGVAFGSPTQLADLNCPLNRLGGNASSRYNWNVNAYNRAVDFFFESIQDNGDPTPGGTADNFISDSKSQSAEPLMTIPMVGWVANLGAGAATTWSFSVKKYGAQTATDPDTPNPDAGNGISTAAGNPFITGNDPNDANVPADEIFQQVWVDHIIGKFGSASNGGLKYYLYDNEPSIWYSTHRDVHPDGPGMDEIVSKTIAYGHMIRGEEPNAILVGPEEWGWDGYFNSGKDLQYYQQNCTQGGCGTLPDRAAHNGADYVPYVLGQLFAHETATGERLLDVFAVHFYPQGDGSGNQENSDDVSQATELLRNTSTRSLWDPNYVDQSYIGGEGINGGIIQLIPMLKGWRDTYYPGIQVGLTEYNWGAEKDMNGATTQADIFGILGREGLDLATRWTMPATGTPVYNAMKMYRNYDGQNSMFGDTSVLASAPNPDHLSAFAAQRSGDNALTVMLINKSLIGNTPVTVNLSNFTASAAQVFHLVANQMGRAADVPVNGGAVSLSLPPKSITLLVLGPAAPAQIQFSSSNYPVSEIAGSATVTLMRTGPLSGTSEVTWTAVDGTAVFPTNYGAQTGNVTFPANAKTATFKVPVSHVTTDDPSKTFVLSLSNPQNAQIGPQAETSVTILDADLPGTIAFAVGTANVTAGGTVVLKVNRTGGLASGVTVDYATHPGTGIDGTDYTGSTGTLVFDPSNTPQSIQIQTLTNPTPEANPSFTVTLGNPGGGGKLGTLQKATVTIATGDAAVQFSTKTYPIGEKAGHLNVVVLRTGALSSPVAVSVTCVDGTAQTGVNYSCPVDPVQIPAGKSSGVFPITIIHDGTHVGNLTFTLQLSPSSGPVYIGGNATATVTVLDADPAAVIGFQVGAVSVNRSTGVVNLKVVRTGGPNGASVDYQAVDGTAVNGIDYTLATGTLTFPAGVTSQPIAIPLSLNLIGEPNQTFAVTLLNPQNQAGLGAIHTETVTLVNGDAGLQFSLANYPVSERATVINVTVSRAGDLSAPVSVTVNCTPVTAVPAVNYDCPSTPVQIGAGKVSGLFPITIHHDLVHTGNLTAQLSLTSPQPQAVAYVGPRSQATLTILDTDPAAVLSLASSYTVNETAGTAQIKVTRTGLMTPGAVQVNYQTSAGTAVAGTDYTDVSGVLIFDGNPGDNVQTFGIPILNGGATNLTVNINLSSPAGANATLGTSHAVLTITNLAPDGKVGFQAPDFFVANAAGSATITVTRSGGAGTATVAYSTVDGTAIGGTDYTMASGTLTFGPGVTSQSFTVPITGGSAPPDRYIGLVLTAGPGTDLTTQGTANLWIVQ